jgi:hypothetical protein
MKEARVSGDQALVAHDQAAEMTQPGESAFESTAVPIAAQHASVLMGGLAVVASG